MCHVLHPRVGEILPLLSTLIESLSISRRLPQIERWPWMTSAAC